MTIVAATRLHFIGLTGIDHGPVCPATTRRARSIASTIPVWHSARRHHPGAAGTTRYNSRRPGTVEQRADLVRG
jgi:hypothetical protein